MSEELTASAITTLDFIANQDGAVFLAGCLQALSKLRSYHVAATYALNSLDDTSTDIALGKFLLPSLQIVDRKIGYVTIIIDRSDNLWIICYLYGKGCSAVECFSKESTRVLPLVKEANFRAFSFASAPELMRKNW